MVNANHRDAVLLARCAQKSEVKECTNRRIISTKTGRGTGKCNLYPIYTSSVPQSQPAFLKGTGGMCLALLCINVFLRTCFMFY